jgi:hypothetical protein
VTAGGFEIGRDVYERGATLKIATTLSDGFGQKVYWKLVGDFSKKDIVGKTSGVLRFDRPGTKVLKIKTGQPKPAAKSTKIGLEMSTDPKFKDITRRLNGPSTSPLFFSLTKKPARDFVTGNWYPSGQRQYSGSYTLNVQEGNSRFDQYYLVFSQSDIDDIVSNFKDGVSQISKLKVFEDSNRNLIFDKADRFAGLISDVNFFDVGEYSGSPKGDWEVDAATDKFRLRQSGRIYIDAIQEFL